MARGPLSLLACLLPLTLPAQQQHKAPPAYAERDMLSPFRKCDEIYPPPDAVFDELRIMRGRAELEGAKLHFDDDGREICDDPQWREARARLSKLRLDPGYLAEIMRRSRNAD